jgi:hypothetical protein
LSEASVTKKQDLTPALFRLLDQFRRMQSWLRVPEIFFHLISTPAKAINYLQLQQQRHDIRHINESNA